MKAVLDNNVVLDAITLRQPFGQSAQKILRFAADGKFDNYLTANSLTDIYYVLQKIVGTVKAKEALSHLIGGFDIIGVDEDDCERALNLPMNDFEDALLVICAEKIDADCIISRDAAFLKAESPIRIITPSDFLDEIEKTDRP